jgi:hypothetical protein
MQPSSEAQLLSEGHKVKPDTGAMASSSQPARAAVEARPQMDLVEYWRNEEEFENKERRRYLCCSSMQMRKY